VYDWTGMLSEIISANLAGTLGGQTYILKLENDGLKIAFNPAYALPADVRDAGEKAIADIIAGTVIVEP